jgi:hypothetical protein
VARARIFISYRRKESAGHANFLHFLLVERFGREQIFMDVDSIEPGSDFPEVIEAAVAKCDILLVLPDRRRLAYYSRPTRSSTA